MLSTEPQGKSKRCYSIFHTSLGSVALSHSLVTTVSKLNELALLELANSGCDECYSLNAGKEHIFRVSLQNRGAIKGVNYPALSVESTSDK